MLVILGVISTLLLHNFRWGGGDSSRLSIGSLDLPVFGVLAALDMWFGIYLMHRWCERFDLDWEMLAGWLPAIILIGYYFSHLFSVALYFPEQLTDVRTLLDPRSQISSFGGMLGGSLVAVWFLRRHKQPILRYMDVLAYGFVGGYIFGRAGCFAIHDHPGVATDFPLAVEIAGQRRHDLGFYEMLLMVALLIGITLMARKSRPADGRVLAFFALAYSPIRFGFDSLRIDDVRYAGMTPGQWCAIAFFLLGLCLVWRGRSRE